MAMPRGDLPAPAKPWPRLDYSGWADTCATLHLWMQVVGKIRLALTPPINHWWGITLYVTARGLTTSAMPWQGACLADRFRLRQTMS